VAKILIIDDSPLARARLTRLFELGGHEIVGSTRDWMHALALYESLQPEIVTLEYMMADKRGEAVLKEFIQLDPDARVIMISGANGSGIEEKILKAGAKAFFRKFGLQKDYLDVIDQVLNGQ